MTIAVYETMRVKDGRIPLWQRHAERIIANCKATSLPEPPDFERVVHDSVHSDQPDHQLRVTWNGEVLEVQHRELPSLDPMRVVTVSVRHKGYRIKTTERHVFDQARLEAKSAGADEGLLLTEEGFVAEGTLFAVGWIESDELCLPTLDLGILPSVGRARVIEVAGYLGHPVREGRFRRGELDGRAVFATTATRGIVPFATLDGVHVPRDAFVESMAEYFWPASA